MEGRTCWCCLSPGPWLCWAPSLPGSADPAPRPPRTRQFLSSSSRQPGCFQEAISCRGRFFFSKESKWGTSWCRLFMGNHCESSFTTHQEGLSLSRLHPALCAQPSFSACPGAEFCDPHSSPQAAAGVLTCGRGSGWMVKTWTGCRQCRASQGRFCMACASAGRS